MWGLLGFLGWGSLYKHKRITPGKNGAFETPDMGEKPDTSFVMM